VMDCGLHHGFGVEAAMQANVPALDAITSLDLSGERKLFIAQFTDIATAKSLHAAWEVISSGTSHKMLLMPQGHTLTEATDDILAACGLMRVVT
jgi:hypothetical protein